MNMEVALLVVIIVLLLAYSTIVAHYMDKKWNLTKGKMNNKPVTYRIAKEKLTGKDVKVMQCGEKSWTDVLGNMYDESELEEISHTISVGDMVSYKVFPATTGVVEQINEQMLMLRQESGNRMALPIEDCTLLMPAKKVFALEHKTVNEVAEYLYQRIEAEGMSLFPFKGQSLFERTEKIHSSKDDETYRVRIQIEIQKI